MIFIMSCQSEHYYAVQSFLDDDELCKIWNIIEIAMNREGYDVENAELSMRLYDSELTEDVESDMEHLLWEDLLGVWQLRNCTTGVLHLALHTL